MTQIKNREYRMKIELLLWIYMKAICEWFMIFSLWRFYNA